MSSPDTLWATPASRDSLSSATLALVRHGESTYVAEGRFQGRHDPPLTGLGERQAGLVAERLADRDAGAPLPLPPGPPLGVWHSPLRRAAQTAGAIATAQPAAIALHPTPEFTEIAQGEWEGQLLPDVKARWSRELEAWRRQPVQSHAPGGESLAEAGARIRRGLDQILGSIGGDALTVLDRDPVPGYRSAASAAASPWAVVVAHDGVFRLALLTLLDVPYERFWSVPFNLCGVTVVEIHDGVATLRAHNLSEHLAPLADEARAAQEARGDRRGAL
jgi:probable phosphoglycerate mutase